MRAFTLLIAASTAVAFAPPQRMPATAQMTTPAAPTPVATSRADRSRTSTALAAARKKTSEMTEEEKAAEKALNQQLLVAKGVLFAAVIGYFAFTSL
mmetsp:Transcript_13126/g.34843  ORF Transcript_13126/g.34843 Transcript_13126/m.34843 type:complete len:97 (+) Transcript_13126:185-475(+)